MEQKPTMKFGHRGGNHPVRDLLTGKIDITAQNHSYAVNERSLENTPLRITHRNLPDVLEEVTIGISAINAGTRQYQGQAAEQEISRESFCPGTF